MLALTKAQLILTDATGAYLGTSEQPVPGTLLVVQVGDNSTARVLGSVPPEHAGLSGRRLLVACCRALKLSST